jgi:EmrB/QacA subfamily drug resistance transporter
MVTLAERPSPPPVRGGSNRRWWALGALALAMLTIGLDTTVLAVALPTLANDLGASTSQLQWFSAAYTLVLAALLLPAGDIGDRLGHKRLLIGGLTVFGLASIACAFATSPAMLIADRALLGIGAAVMMPLSMAVLPTLFPDAADRQRALTVWVTATSLGLPLGPIVGGWLLEHFWWGSVFLINVPVVLVGIVAIAAFVPSSRGSAEGSFDTLGAILSSAGLLALTYGFIEAGRRGWSDALSLGAMAAGGVLLVVFVLVERGRTHPLVDLKLFRSREFAWGSVLATLAGFLLFGIIFTVPQYSQAVLGAGPMGTGLRLLPLIGGLVVGARLGGTFARRVAPGLLIAGGFVLLALAGFLASATTLSTSYGFVAAWLVVAGAGFGLVMPVAMSAALAALPPGRAGSGSGLVQAMRQAGGTIGVAVLGTVLGHGYASRLALPASVPAALRERAGESVSAGVAVASKLGGDGLVVAVQRAFMHGMSLVMLTSALLAVASIVLALLTFGRSGCTPDADRTQSVHVE